MNRRTVVACRMVDTPEARADIKAMFPLAPDIEDGLFGPGYEGCLESACDTCQRRIWVGPRQTDKWAQDATIEKLCMVCAVFMHKLQQATGAGEPQVVNLGNTDTIDDREK